MGRPVAQAFERLQSMAATGGLAAVCARRDITLLLVYGSALTDAAAAGDLDVAVRFGDHTSPDLPAVEDELYQLAESECVDLLVLGSDGPGDAGGDEQGEHALATGRVLFAAPGLERREPTPVG